MRHRIGLVVTTCAALLLTVVGAVAAPTAVPAGAAGVPGLGLPLVSGRDIAVDPGTGRLFVTGDDAVVVRTPAGAALAKITGIPGAQDLHVAGGAVYATAARGGRIVRIDPVGLTVTKSWTAPTTFMRGLTLHAGRLWTIATGSSSGVLTSIDVATGAVTAYGQVGLSAEGAPLVLSTATHLVVVAPNGVATFTVAGPVVTPVATFEPELGRPLRDATLSPDGTRVLVDALDGPYGVVELALPALTPVAEHPRRGRVEAVAATAAGGGLIAAAGAPVSEAGSPDLHLYRPDVPAPVGGVGTDRGEGRRQVPGAAAFSADGTVVWIVRDDVYDNPLQPVIVPVPLVPSEVGAFPRTVAPTGAATTVTGSGFTGAEVTVDGAPATITSARPTTLEIDLPTLDTGPATLAVEGLTGASDDTGLVVRDLGPFTTSLHLTEEVEDGFYPGVGVNAGWALEEDAQLAAGGSIGGLAATITRSDDWVRYRNLAARLYLATFDRPADPDGLRYWWGELHQRSLVSVAAFFARSSEFQATYGALDDEEFVARIYQNVLGRSQDAAGAAYWEDRLARGLSRGAVLAHFSESAEHRALSQPEVDATFLFVALLQRSPSPGELAATAGRLRAGATLAAEAEALLRSPEYATLLG